MANAIKPRADNVLLVLEPLETRTASGLSIVPGNPKRMRGSRTARVLASGPGYWYSRRQRLGSREFSAPTEVFVPNETKPGDRVIIDADHGQDYKLDLEIPRHNLSTEFQELLGERAEFRMVRESGEILAILDEDTKVDGLHEIPKAEFRQSE